MGDKLKEKILLKCLVIPYQYIILFGTLVIFQTVYMCMLKDESIQKPKMDLKSHADWPRSLCGRIYSTYTSAWHPKVKMFSKDPITKYVTVKRDPSG